MWSKFLFRRDSSLVLCGEHGERYIHFSRVDRALFLAGIAILAVFPFIMLGSFAYNQLTPQSAEALSEQLRLDYEARLEAVTQERDKLSLALEQSRENSKKLVANLGAQQSLLFDEGTRNQEMDYYTNNLRDTLLEKHNELASLEVALATQTEQQAGGADNATLGTMTKFLGEAANERDEARREVQGLQQKIALKEEQDLAAMRKRDVFFSQLEAAIETSLVPMEKALGESGVNVNGLLEGVKKNYSGTGGKDLDVDFTTVFGNAAEKQRAEKILTDIDKLATTSYAIQQLPLADPLVAAYRVTSPFGYRRHPISGRSKMHTGIDMAAKWGTPVLAPGSGVVTAAGWETGYGKTIRVRHANGIDTVYAHLSTISVAKGQQVKFGQQIGNVGSTGRSTGPHLHYEVRVNGAPTNPSKFLKVSHYVQQK